MEKSKLLKRNRKLVERVEVLVDGEPLVFDIRKPTMGDRIVVLERATAAGELNESHEPVGLLGAKRLQVRAAACVLHDPATGLPAFTDSDLEGLLDVDWLDEIQPKIDAVFSPPSEEARKNS